MNSFHQGSARDIQREEWGKLLFLVGKSGFTKLEGLASHCRVPQSVSVGEEDEVDLFGDLASSLL